MIGDRWQVTDAEVQRPYPCDDFVRDPGLEAWRGITAQAPAAQVWPWVAQLRLAPYSYDWIDNRGRRSPRELRGLPDPQVGEYFTTALGGRRTGRILAVEPGVQLTGTIMGVVMSYVLAPAGNDTTRLLLKVVAGRGGAGAVLLCLGDLVMARKQLRTLARLAEETSRHGGAARG
jgi:hypothetical protein